MKYAWIGALLLTVGCASDRGVPLTGMSLLEDRNPPKTAAMEAIEVLRLQDGVLKADKYRVERIDANTFRVNPALDQGDGFTASQVLMPAAAVGSTLKFQSSLITDLRDKVRELEDRIRKLESGRR